jgi:hypothetical protein
MPDDWPETPDSTDIFAADLLAGETALVTGGVDVGTVRRLWPVVRHDRRVEGGPVSASDHVRNSASRRALRTNLYE